MPKLDRSIYKKGSEQVYVKHYLLEKYLSNWGYIIGGSEWDSLVFVDGFAGPWGSEHEGFADASFGIAVRTLNEVIDGLYDSRQIVVRGLCVFVETKPNPFAKLDTFAKENSSDKVRALALRGRFIENIKAIDEQVGAIGTSPFKFVFLDQKGWAATPMEKLSPFLRKRSCEVLFNLMTSFLTRFVEAKGREASYHKLFGRPGALEKIRALPKGTGEREEAAVQEYCKSLKEICGFRYVSQAIILDPSKEKVRYHLVFATNSLRGIEVFKNAEMEAAGAQDEVRHEKLIEKTSQTAFLFDGAPPQSPKMSRLYQHHTTRARQKIIESMADSNPNALPYKELYGEAMAFPLVTPRDLHRWVIELRDKGAVKILWDGANRKKLSWAKNNSIVVANARLLQ